MFEDPLVYPAQPPLETPQSSASTSKRARRLLFSFLTGAKPTRARPANGNSIIPAYNTREAGGCDSERYPKRPDVWMIIEPVPEPPLNMTVGGAKVAVEFAGNPEIVNATPPVKSPAVVKLSGTVVAWPAFSVADATLEVVAMVKSGLAIASITAADVLAAKLALPV